MNSKTNTVRAILLDASECDRPEADHPATIEICADDLQRILERHITEPAQCLLQIAEPATAGTAVRAFRDYLGVHDGIKLGGQAMDDMALDLARIALDFKHLVEPRHPDDAAVDALAVLMKAKLAKQRAKGYGGWNDKIQCTQQRLSTFLRTHVDKGDPVDVANFCAMLSARGEGITAQATPLPLLLRDIARDIGITVPEACAALKPWGDYSTNSAVTAEMAVKLREAFPNRAPQAVQPAVPTDADIDAAMQAFDWDGWIDQDKAKRAFTREALARWAAPAHLAEGVPAQAFKTKVYQALGIGSACNEDAVFVNIENARRRADCLSAIEREFFMVETPPDESEGDTEPGEECLLNWGHAPTQYVQQFAKALAATQPAAQGLKPCKPIQPEGMTSINARLSFNFGWLACERHHGIRPADVAEALALVAAQAKQGGAA